MRAIVIKLLMAVAPMVVEIRRDGHPVLADWCRCT